MYPRFNEQSEHLARQLKQNSSLPEDPPLNHLATNHCVEDLRHGLRKVVGKKTLGKELVRSESEGLYLTKKRDKDPVLNEMRRMQGIIVLSDKGEESDEAEGEEAEGEEEDEDEEEPEAPSEVPIKSEMSETV